MQDQRQYALFRVPVVVKRHTQSRVGTHYDVYLLLPPIRYLGILIKQFGLDKPENNDKTLDLVSLYQKDRKLQQHLRALVIRYWPEFLGESHLCILTKYIIPPNRLLFEGFISPPKPGYGKYTLLLKGYAYFWQYRVKPRFTMEFSIEAIKKSLDSKFEGTYMLLPDAKYIVEYRQKMMNEYTLREMKEGKLRMYRVRDRKVLFKQLVP